MKALTKLIVGTLTAAVVGLAVAVAGINNTDAAVSPMGEGENVPETEGTEQMSERDLPDDAGNAEGQEAGPPADAGPPEEAESSGEAGPSEDAGPSEAEEGILGHGGWMKIMED